MAAGIAIAALLATTGAPLTGQVIPGPRLTTPECQAAIGALEAGSRQSGRWWRVADCSAEGGIALANALRRARSETDSTYLQSLWGASSRIRSPDVLAAAREVASDRGASQPARVVSLMVLVGTYDKEIELPLDLSWHELVTVPRGSSCRLGFFTDIPEYASELPMPGDYVQQIAAAVERLRDDPTESPTVRDLAGCIRGWLTDALPETVDPTLIRLTYLCDTQFRITNDSETWVGVSYAVEGTTDRGDLSVAPRDELKFWTHVAGPTSLTYQGQVIATARNRGTPCSR